MAKQGKTDDGKKTKIAKPVQVDGDEHEASSWQAQANRTYDILGDPTEGISLARKATGVRNTIWDE